MATSHVPSRLTVPGRYGEGLVSSSSSVSGRSTESFLSQLPGGLSLLETIRDLRDYFNPTSHALDPRDALLWEQKRQVLADLVFNHGAKKRTMHHETSWDAKVVDGKKVVYIGCKNRKAEKQVKEDLKECGAIDYVLEVLNFDAIQVSDNFKGHLAKIDLATTSVSKALDLRKPSLLGIPFEVPNSEGNSSVTTLGGVVLVDGKPYALATGCPFSSHGDETASRGEVVVYSYAGSGHPQESPVAQEIMRQRRESFHSAASSDWALISLPDGELPLNLTFDMREESSISWPWPSAGGHIDPLVERIVTEEDLKHLRTLDQGWVACLTYPTSSASGPVPGLIAPETSTLMLSGVSFTVLRIDMFTPLEHGDSGSWVIVGNAVCGIIIAGFGQKLLIEEISDSVKDSKKPHLEPRIFSGYMLPMKDVLEQISQTLRVEIFLPTRVDYRINCLKLQHQAGRWAADSATPRCLDMELLLGEQKQRNRKKEDAESFGFGFEHYNIPMTLFLPHQIGWISRHILEDSIGLRYETIYRLLSLSDICPLSLAFRPGLRQWARDYRKSRWHNRRTFVCTTIIEQCLQNEAGENILGLLIFLWKTQRQQKYKGSKRDPENQKRRIAWLAQLLSSLFGIMATPKVAIPSIQQLQIFVYFLISAFKDKDLRHFYLLLDANYQVRSASPSDESWSTDLPPRPKLINRAWRTVKGWAAGRAEEACLVDVDEALSYSPEEPTTWDHSVVSTMRILVLLCKIHASDRSKLLVYCGNDSTWISFYAAVILGLDVHFRSMHPFGAQPMPQIFRQSKHLEGCGQADVVVYFGGPSGTEHVCEIIDRIDVGQVGIEAQAPESQLTMRRNKRKGRRGSSISV
ncbi:hypothetical protein FCIRC_10011 [Fusarium circinatum]|uniref:Uncharacterized protein n=1 Tax=Fusarium circinatum TaxID=48490 RepID=A0A8H5WL52_FUSCI|nr:hypothetical protein FCIRC_10011 [Fusarium circinatum]